MAERAGTDRSHAVYQARVVFEILDEATTGGLMERVREALPDDVRHLAEAGSRGEMR